jgi:hypothetical protein
MPKSAISVVPIGKKVCKPFLLEVMVFSPEAGYKFKVIVERSCTPEADDLRGPYLHEQPEPSFQFREYWTDVSGYRGAFDCKRSHSKVGSSHRLI